MYFYTCHAIYQLTIHIDLEKINKSPEKAQQTQLLCLPFKQYLEGLAYQ